MAEDGTKTTLSEEELAALAPSDRAHYEVKGRLGDGLDTEDTESTKAAREAAFGADTSTAEPDPSSVTTTRSPEPDEGGEPALEGDPDSEGADTGTPPPVDEVTDTEPPSEEV